MAFENTSVEAERMRQERLKQTLAEDKPVCDTTGFVLDNRYIVNDNVNRPAHYTSGGIECIDAIREQMPREAYVGFLQGNVVKYLWRWRQKAGVESLKKGQWYLNRLIKELEDDA